MASIGAIMLIVSVAPHDGFAQTPPEAEPITITVEIVAADVTQNQIQVRLEPAGVAGTLTLELRNPDAHVILNAQPRTGSTDIQNETFDLDNWTDDAIGRYTRLRATWTVGTTDAQNELVFPEGMRLDVLGHYEHSQYNTPTETDCTGDNVTACLVTDNQCTYQQIDLRSQFRAGALENGSETSINSGRLQWGDWCANNPNFPPPAGCAAPSPNQPARTFAVVTEYTGVCDNHNALVVAGETVAVGLNRNLTPQNPDGIACGDRIFIYHPDYPELQVIKIVTDRCRACANERHIDNYIGETGCNQSTFTYPDNPITIRLY